MPGTLFHEVMGNPLLEEIREPQPSGGEELGRRRLRVSPHLVWACAPSARTYT